MAGLDISIEEARAALLGVIRRESLQFGDFVLSSGAHSDYYIDLRKTTTHPEGAFLTARLFLDAIRSAPPDAVGGPTLGADPIAGAVAAVGHLMGVPTRTFLVRKDAKEHGTRNQIEGHLEPGWSAVVLDDVVTRGGSLVKAVTAVREAGARVDRVLAIVDRGEGGRETLAEAGLELEALFRIEDVLDGRKD